MQLPPSSDEYVSLVTTHQDMLHEMHALSVSNDEAKVGIVESFREQEKEIGGKMQHERVSGSTCASHVE